MGLNALGLGFILEAKDLAGEVVERFEGKVERLEHTVEKGAESMTKKFSGLKLGLAELGAGFGILAGSFLAAHEAGKFTAALQEATTTMNATAEEADRLRDAALGSRAALLGLAPEEVAGALNELAHEGGNATESLQTLDASMVLAKITGKELGQEAKFLDDTLNQFHLSAEDAHRTVDKFAVSSHLLGLNVKELDVAMQGVASGSQLAGASLDDTLITLGLAKKALPEVSMAARATNMAMTLLAEPKAKQSIQSLGVALTDAHGRARPLIEVLGDLSTRLNRMTEAQRASYLATTFGGRAAGGLSVILDQLSNGVTDATGNVRKGAAAVEELRKQLDQTADDAAENLAAQLGQNLPAQEKVFAASMARLTTVVGEPFQNLFGRLLAGVNGVVNRVTDAFAKLPKSTRDFLAKLALVASAVLAISGAVTVLVAIWPILSAVALPVLGALASAFGEVLVPVALVGAGLYALKYAFEHNLGGIRDVVQAIWTKVSVTFRAIASLVTSGKISGPLLEGFRGAGAGVQQFAITAFLWFGRVKNFLVQLVGGFRAVLAQLGPQLEVFVGAIKRIGQAFGVVGDGPAAAKDKFEQFGEAGMELGKVLGVAFGAVVAVVTGAANVVGGAVSAVSSLLGGLGDVVAGVVSVIQGVFSGNWTKVWQGFKQVVFGTVSAVVGVLASLVGVVAGVVDAIGSMFGKDLGIQKDIEKFKRDLDRGQRVEFGLAAEANPAALPKGPLPLPPAAPGGVGAQPAAAQAGAQIASNADLAAALKGAQRPAQPQIMHTHITLQVEGEALARATHRQDLSDASRSFQPVPLATT